MQNNFHNIISLLLVCGILIAVFYRYPDKDKIDFKKQIVDFTRYEDERNIDKVLSYFVFPLLEYWQDKEVSKNELKNLYQGYWKRYVYSANEIQKIEKVGDNEFVLTTNYIYSKSINNLNRYRLSETKFKFNQLGNITSITNLSLKKIDDQYILDNNLIRDFSYTENIPKKNNSDLAIFLSIVLLVNLIIQVVNTKGAKSKLVKDTTTKYKSLNKVVGKKVPNENLREKSINELKLKEQLALDELNNRIEEEKKVLKDKFFKEASIKAEKVRIESEKKLAAQREAERIRKNKIAKEKREEKERLEKEIKLAAQKEADRIKRNKIAREKREEKKRLVQLQKEKDEARRKREKAVIKKRQDKERELREKEEEESRGASESNIVLVDEDEDEDDFFDDNLSQYITEIPDDDIDETESDISNFLTDKYMSKNLKNKLKNK